MGEEEFGDDGEEDEEAAAAREAARAARHPPEPAMEKLELRLRQLLTRLGGGKKSVVQQEEEVRDKLKVDGVSPSRSNSRVGSIRGSLEGLGPVSE
eukprot:3261638-Prymnesium_polylepis.1